MSTAAATHNRATTMVGPEPVAGLAPLDEADAGFGGPEFGRHNPRDDDGDDGTVLSELERLRRTVEVEHDRRFQRVESDLRWVIMLTTAQLVALVGGAIATFTLS